jgi:hypothetical protein
MREKITQPIAVADITAPEPSLPRRLFKVKRKHAVTRQHAVTRERDVPWHPVSFSAASSHSQRIAHWFNGDPFRLTARYGMWAEARPRQALDEAGART